jgi:hypothetical protein
LYQQPNGDYIAEFIPLLIGEHRIDILYSNQPISGSPYFTNAYDPNAAELTQIPAELIVGADNLVEGRFFIFLLLICFELILFIHFLFSQLVESWKCRF